VRGAANRLQAGTVLTSPSAKTDLAGRWAPQRRATCALPHGLVLPGQMPSSVRLCCQALTRLSTTFCNVRLDMLRLTLTMPVPLHHTGLQASAVCLGAAQGDAGALRRHGSVQCHPRRVQLTRVSGRCHAGGHRWCSRGMGACGATCASHISAQYNMPLLRSRGR